MKCKKCKKKMKIIVSIYHYVSKKGNTRERYKCSFCGYEKVEYSFQASTGDFASFSQPDG